MKTYEGMFLLDAGQGNFEQAVAPVRAVLERSGAEVLHLKKWDERRLAYEIAGRRRALYLLTYFKADPDKITEIEHNVRLNEQILRVLILSADHISAETMAAATPAESDSASRDSDRGDRDDEGQSRRRSGPRRPSRTEEGSKARPRDSAKDDDSDESDDAKDDSGDAGDSDDDDDSGDNNDSNSDEDSDDSDDN